MLFKNITLGTLLLLLFSLHSLHGQTPKELPGYIPSEVEDYIPPIVPPENHPRLWVNQNSLPIVRSRLTEGENAGVWQKLQEKAKVRYSMKLPDDGKPDAKLEEIIKTKAFYYLMTGNKQQGEEALSMTLKYLPLLSFDDLQIKDITREIGRAIYIASLVYDWCYDLFTPEERNEVRNKMIRLAHKMTIGWPPFKESIINGHGNEAQINRDLLSMSIATYNEDPEPYKYTSYLILEELVPMRKFEYQSPRHNQGVDYGAYRFGWEMHAAWLFYRMSGEYIFDSNIRNMAKFWQYMRLPSGQMLRDGDRFNVNDSDSAYYWKQPVTALLTYAYNQDPHLKAEFESQGGLPQNPVLFLLINDPGIKAERHYESLGLTKDFGPILGSMIARTGWDQSYKSDDVIAEIKGGGYHFGNHQHADAGDLQIFYKGFQIGDLGLYLTYGSVYDFNFNKRSIAHSMMLAVDPNEQVEGARWMNRDEHIDGGTRFNQRFPKTPEETKTDPWFNNGTVLSSSFGPSKQRPFYSYFKADLTGAYTSKMSNYRRRFCFLNLDKEKIPAAIILSDDMTTSKPEFEKYWQVNTLNTPVKTDTSIILHNQRGGMVGKTHVNMLVPSPANRQTTILSGSEAYNVFGHHYKQPSLKLPEASGTRIMISPKKANKRDRFLTVFQMTAGDTDPLPVSHNKTKESDVVILADRVVSMSKDSDLITDRFTIQIPADNNHDQYQVLLAGLKPGFWNVHSPKGTTNFNAEVTKGENTIFFRADGGKYIITPGREYGAQTHNVDQTFMPSQ